MKRLVITGIGTGIGKTLVSSIFVQALDGDYWKPIQAGSLKATDSDRVRSLVTAPQACIHPECYRLPEPRSPHAAAQSQGIRIVLADMVPPETARPLIIEGAGGVLVPLNDTELMVDFFEKLDAHVVLVSQHYLGSINHTLLSAEALKSRRIPVLGIVFNGNRNPETEAVILQHTAYQLLLNVQSELQWTPETTQKYADLLQITLRKHELV
jgi:dethiobiotin synthetase